MNNWKDISTAPKARRILLAYESGYVCCGQYNENFSGFVGDTQINQPISIVKLSQPIAWQELQEFAQLKDQRNYISDM